jgi:GT2 family glycosyltransferase
VLKRGSSLHPSVVPDPSVVGDAVTVVVITRNRCDELERTLRHLTSLPGAPSVILIDNASTDGTAGVLEKFPAISTVRLERNFGAAARNVGVDLARTPYVAFSDDDSWWEKRALETAMATLDSYPRLAVVAARVLVGEERVLDATCAVMADSGVPHAPDLPGVPVYGFLACGAVVHRERYLSVGGFPERFGVGGEEAALSLALAREGWGLSYMSDVVAFHHPSPSRDPEARRAAVTRNDLWVAWEFRPLGVAIRCTARAAVRAPSDRDVRRGVVAALRQLPAVLQARDPVPPSVEADLRLLDPPSWRRANRSRPISARRIATATTTEGPTSVTER